MTKVARYIIIILAALFLLSLFMALQSNTSRDLALKEFKDREVELRKATEGLAQQLNMAKEEKKRLLEKMDTLNKDFAKISTERDDWRSKYDSMQKEKEQLMAKIDELSRAAEQQPQAIAPVTTDEYWAGILKEKATLEMQIKDLQEELANDKLALEEAKKTKTEMELELGRLKQNQEEIERKLKYSSDLANTLSLESARDKNEKRFISDKLEALKAESSELRTQVKELATSKLSLHRSLQRLLQDKTALETQLAKTEEIIQNRVNDMIDIKKDIETATKARGVSGIEGKTVQLPPIVVKAQGVVKTPDIAPAWSRMARVISVNEQNNFVIIDAGENAGLKIGDTFKVYRDNEEIGIIEVIQTRKDISAADIKQKTREVQTGDLVK